MYQWWMMQHAWQVEHFLDAPSRATGLTITRSGFHFPSYPHRTEHYQRLGTLPTFFEGLLSFRNQSDYFWPYQEFTSERKPWCSIDSIETSWGLNWTNKWGISLGLDFACSLEISIQNIRRSPLAFSMILALSPGLLRCFPRSTQLNLVMLQ